MNAACMQQHSHKKSCMLSGRVSNPGQCQLVGFDLTNKFENDTHSLHNTPSPTYPVGVDGKGHESFTLQCQITNKAGDGENTFCSRALKFVVDGPMPFHDGCRWKGIHSSSFMLQTVPVPPLPSWPSGVRFKALVASSTAPCCCIWCCRSFSCFAI